MAASDLFEGFDDFAPRDYEDEARERWGHTGAYQQSARRTAAYTTQDWRRIRAEAADITAGYVRAMDDGLAPGHEAVQALVSCHHAYLSANFYELTPEMYGGLADLWVQDARFTKNIDKARPGLAAYPRDAVKAWVARAAGRD